jgi:tRNA threonylcarbamoyladenosine biosynthesis protein TsaB
MSDSPLILGVDTSGHAGSIALIRGGEVLEERSLSATGRRHARTLVAEIQAMLHGQGVAPRDVSLVAVSQGPGSFTGLRVGVVFAKTFAFATGCRLAAVDTFAVIAMNAPDDASAAWVIDDAQRGALFVGQYRRDGGGVMRLVEPIAILEESDFVARVVDGDLIVGPGVRRNDAATRGRTHCLAEEQGTPRGSVVARLGREMADRGEVVDPFQLVPFYLRRSAAEEVAERKAMERAGGAG